MKIQKSDLKKMIKECLVEEGLFGKKKKKEEPKSEFDIDKAFSALKGKSIKVDGTSKNNLEFWRRRIN